MNSYLCRYEYCQPMFKAVERLVSGDSQVFAKSKEGARDVMLKHAELLGIDNFSITKITDITNFVNHITNRR